MEVNYETSNPQPFIMNKLYCESNNHQKNTCGYDIFDKKIEINSNNKNKKHMYNALNLIMKGNNQYLELLKSTHPRLYGHSDNAIGILFGWSVGVNIKELSEYLDVKEDTVKHLYLLSTLYAKRYIKNHLDDFKVGGPGVVVLIDVYPAGCSKFDYSTTTEHSSILCFAELKDIPTKYWFQILNQTESSRRNEEILDAVKTMVRPGSTLAIDLQSTALTESSYYKLKCFYKIVVNVESLKKHDTENVSLFNNLETIWKPALDICELANYHSDIASYYTSYLWNQRFGNDNLNMLFSLF